MFRTKNQLAQWGYYQSRIQTTFGLGVLGRLILPISNIRLLLLLLLFDPRKSSPKLRKKTKVALKRLALSSTSISSNWSVGSICTKHIRLSILPWSDWSRDKPKPSAKLCFHAGETCTATARKAKSATGKGPVRMMILEEEVACDDKGDDGSWWWWWWWLTKK